MSFWQVKLPITKDEFYVTRWVHLVNPKVGMTFNVITSQSHEELPLYPNISTTVINETVRRFKIKSIKQKQRLIICKLIKD